jgi:hypothetical protein
VVSWRCQALHRPGRSLRLCAAARLDLLKIIALLSASKSSIALVSLTEWLRAKGLRYQQRSRDGVQVADRMCGHLALPFPELI